MSKVAAAVFWFLLPFWAFLALFAAVRLTVGQPAPAALDWAVLLGSAASVSESSANDPKRLSFFSNTRVQVETPSVKYTVDPQRLTPPL